MLITCPSCAAEYNVPGPLAPGRKVRCARCSGQWAPVPPVPGPVPAVEPAPVPAPVALSVPAALPEPPPPAPSQKLIPIATPVLRKPPRRLPLLLAWGGSILLLAGLLAAALIWREPIMQAWPPSVRLFSALGLTAHP